MTTPAADDSLSYIISDDASDPVVAAAVAYAERLNRRRRPLSWMEATVVTLLRRVRELEAENAMFRRLG